jgi:quinol monooxygenase YgiN
MLEEWHDERSLNEHLSSNHFREIVPLFSEYLEKEMEVII